MSSPPRALSRSVAPDRRGGIGREQISDIQRARILAAMTAVAAEHGAAHATVTHVVARSGVSRRTFYELFEDREDCFLAAFDEAVRRIAAVVVPAYEQPPRWRERLRAALVALLELVDYDRRAGRLVIVEALGAGPKALARRHCVLVQITAVVDLGRAEARQGHGPPSLTAEGLVGGVLALIHGRLLDEEEATLLDLVNPLMSMIVLPYLGAAAARRELARPVPPAAANGALTLGVYPLRDLEMRLTYRTVRVLLAVGELGGPGSGPSNRQVADASGIRDQGQISKLLARLEHLGLIENTGHPRTKGEPNRWTLTNRGSQVRQAVSVQPGP